MSDFAPGGPFHLREMLPDDLGAVLALNRKWQHVTSPLTLEALEHLYDLAAVRVVATVGDAIVAFALAFGPGVDYDSPNYLWFDRGPSDFLYIDRVMVSSAVQRSGLGNALYARVFDSARAIGARRVVCEVDKEPMNAASDAFHQRWGFVDVGTQRVNSKRVSLRERVLDHDGRGDGDVRSGPVRLRP